MAEKVSTGVAKLDQMLDGGFMQGSIILAIGEPGTGKTTLLRNFLYQGVTNGEDCIYFVTNRSLDHILGNMEKFGWNVKDKENIRFILYDGVVNERTKSFVGNFEDLIDITYNCEKLIGTFTKKKTRMIVDELSYLFLMNNREVVFKFLHRISQILRKNNISCLIEVQKGMLDPSIVTALESMTDGTIELKRENNRRDLRISRLEEKSVKADWISFDIEAGVGIDMDAERTLDEWEKILMERDEQEDVTRIKSLLKDVRSGSLSRSDVKDSGIFKKLKRK
ncbi:MAG: hypothetical protein JXB14_05690 [Candidatus Altiarchaeota archaeon]|nr:hypothetical protein [Candidatus Altiarchaeota archaeon]